MASVGHRAKIADESDGLQFPGPANGGRAFGNAMHGKRSRNSRLKRLDEGRVMREDQQPGKSRHRPDRSVEGETPAHEFEPGRTIAATRPARDIPHAHLSIQIRCQSVQHS
jgi:hypothetical protein